MYGLLTPVQSTGQQTPVRTIPEHDPAASSSFSPLDLQTPLRPTTIVLSGQQTLPTLLQSDAESQLPRRRYRSPSTTPQRNVRQKTTLNSKDGDDGNDEGDCTPTTGSTGEGMIGGAGRIDNDLGLQLPQKIGMIHIPPRSYPLLGSNSNAAHAAPKPPCRRFEGGRPVNSFLNIPQAEANADDSNEDQIGDELPEEEFQWSQDQQENQEPASARVQCLNAYAQLSASQPDKPSLPTRAQHFLLALHLVCRNIIQGSSDDFCQVSDIFRLIQGDAHITSLLSTSTKDDSLESLASRCNLMDSCMNTVDFVYMVNCIQLRCKVIRCDLFFQCNIVF